MYCGYGAFAVPVVCTLVWRVKEAVARVSEMHLSPSMDHGLLLVRHWLGSTYVPSITHHLISHEASPYVEVGGWRGGGVVGRWVGCVGWRCVRTEPNTGGGCRLARPSLCSTGPKSWLSGSKGKRTGTAPMDHTVVPVCRRCHHGACVWRVLRIVCARCSGSRCGG